MDEEHDQVESANNTITVLVIIGIIIGGYIFADVIWGIISALPAGTG